MSEFVVERAVSCLSDVRPLWDLLTDTERMNRAVGMERVEYRPLSGATSARFLGHTTLGGFSVDYEEKPFEWAYLRRFCVVRKMRSGPASELSHSLDFVPEGDGTKVTVRLRITPRVGILTPFMKLSASQTLKKFEREIRKVDAALHAGAKPPSMKRRGAIDEDAILRAAERMGKGEEARGVERLVTLVREGSDVDAARMRPYELADAWGVDRRELLELMLRAVRAGLLDLRWEIVCPSCRVATETVRSLSELKNHGACQLCELEFGLELDEAVEATFAPSASVREVDDGPYCIGGPARVPHVVAQGIAAAGGSVDLAAPPDAGHYRVFVRGGKTAQLEVAVGAPASTTVGEEGGAERFSVAPSGVVRVLNTSATERHAKIERSTWASQAATAREVTSLPAFRRDFASDVLRPGSSLRVSRVTLFFSDLTGSTELYSTMGDAAAFRLVQDHFDVVLSILEQHHGSLVKTIGDAVMAAFGTDEEALVASIAILREFEKFRRMEESRQRTHIKLGAFGGPCYVVTANGVLDYFGQTVNVAARLQAQAASGEVVVEADLADRALAKGILLPEMIVERYAAALKGVTEPVHVARISLAKVPLPLVASRPIPS